MVPLALALLNISHPDFAVIDQLSRLTHDADADVAQSAIMVRDKLGGFHCVSRGFTEALLRLCGGFLDSFLGFPDLWTRSLSLPTP